MIHGIAAYGLAGNAQPFHQIHVCESIALAYGGFGNKSVIGIIVFIGKVISAVYGKVIVKIQSLFQRRPGRIHIGKDLVHCFFISINRFFKLAGIGSLLSGAGIHIINK
ncbi:MAG: hypothetical protein K1W25_17825 [Lachnospiraceae bacterium]